MKLFFTVIFIVLAALIYLGWLENDDGEDE